MRLLLLILAICLGAFAYNHSGLLKGDFLQAPAPPSQPKQTYPGEDAHFYYLTDDEIRFVVNVIQKSINSYQFQDVRLTNGTIVRISYRPYGNICPKNGRPLHMSVNLAKQVVPLNNDRTQIGTPTTINFEF